MAAKRTGVIVLGSINMDLVVRVPRMPRPGETTLGGTFMTNLGGKGANQAVAAARAALASVAFMAAVGEDAYGREALETLGRESHLVLDYVRTIPQVATGVALIMVDAAGENMISVASGANAMVTADMIDQLAESVWRAASVFLACLETPLAAVEHGLARAKEFGLLTILNPAPACADAGRGELLKLVDVLTPNEGEALALAGSSAENLSVVDAAQILRRRGAGQVIVTCGRNGCQLVGGRHHGGWRRVQWCPGRRPGRGAFAGGRGTLGLGRGGHLGDPPRGDRLAGHARRDRAFAGRALRRPAARGTCLFACGEKAWHSETLLRPVYPRRPY
jgi:ribokinase